MLYQRHEGGDSVATMKTHSFGFNVDDPEQNAASNYCDELKREKELSKYIRRLVLEDIKVKRQQIQQQRRSGGGLTVSVPQISKNRP